MTPDGGAGMRARGSLALPTFLGIGANKAGTSSLYALLRQHPQVFFPHRKELHFFSNDRNYERGVEWYLREFFAGAEGYRARGEITPAYLYAGAKVIPRLVAAYGSEPPRLFAILRDPVARAYSRYWHERRIAGGEPLSFEDALAAEEARVVAEAERLDASGKPARLYFRGGLYGEQLQRYYDAFPRDRLHVLLLDDLLADGDATLRALFLFLGVDPDVSVQPVRRNVASEVRAPRVDAWIRSRSTVGRVLRQLLPERAITIGRRTLRRVLRRPFSYPPMNPDTEARLRERYLPDVQALERLLGRDLRAWYPRR